MSVSAEAPLILPSFTKPTSGDLDELMALTARERSWNTGMPTYADERDIMLAHASHELVKISPDTNLRPITRFLNPDLHATYPPFLRPAAAKVLERVGILWRQKADEVGIDQNIRLSVTSMVRSVGYQERLVASGKPAVPDSSHTYGLAFDIDQSGYYVRQSDGTDAAVTKRPDTHRQIVGQKLLVGLGVAVMEPAINDRLQFDSRVPQVLDEAVRDMHDNNVLNAVPEFPNGENACLHIGVNPLA